MEVHNEGSRSTSRTAFDFRLGVAADLHKLVSDFVTKPSFSLTRRENLLTSRATISRALSRDETTAALMRGPLNSSGPSRSQSRHSIETFDCLAMREPNTNVNACL